MADKVKRVTYDGGETYGVRWECPGCKAPHVVPTSGPQAWSFNGNFEKPTLTPSVLVHPHGILLDDGTLGQTPLCHTFVRDRRIEFLSDCTHALAGQTVEMENVS